MSRSHAMAKHRLPGVSIDLEQWRGLSEVAASLGITRSDAIRLAIAQLIDPASNPLAQEAITARRQLLAIEAVLAAGREPTVAA
jgi:antitoxin component of RelBE/YafQ-DinJ toxin-antitoxin module